MKILFIAILCFVSLTLKAQTLFGTSGGSAADAVYQVDFSLGEATTAEIIHPEARVNIGFQQPWYDFFLAAKPTQSFDSQLFPNPFTGSFHFSTTSEIESYSLFDARGRKVFHSTVTGPAFTHSDVNLPKGLYSLRVVFKNGKPFHANVINQ